MPILSSKILIFIAFLFVYIYGTKGRPNNLEDETIQEDKMNFEESVDLLKKSKTRSGEEKKGHRGSKENKKQVIDAVHLGPYHHGHPWGTLSHWPGYHWTRPLAFHGGWTGYPSLGGWHRSHITKMKSKKSGNKVGLKRQVLPKFVFPTHGFAYPSLGFAAVPFTPSFVPWTYRPYRSKVQEKPSKEQTRSSMKAASANKRWWPGYMGGWGGWGIGNAGYPGWGPLGGFWGHGFDAAGLGYGWGVGNGDVVHPFLRSKIPGKQSKKDKAEKRWWPGYMGGWGGWGLGNTGYPGWGPLGADWGHGLSPYGYNNGLGHYDYGHGFSPYGFGHGFGLGYEYGLGHRKGITSKKEGKEEEGPKRQAIHEPYGAYGSAFPYGPFGIPGSPFLGYGAYAPYPEAIYGEFSPYYGSYPHAKSDIPTRKSKKVNKEAEKEEEAPTSRHFVVNFNPGRYGWGGAIHPGHNYHSVFPLLGAVTYSGLYGGYYGPYGPPQGSFGPYHRSEVPDNEDETGQGRQVINYHPGCCGWGGCIYPGCGLIGKWTWPLPCHFHHHHHHCVPCWTRSKFLKMQDAKEEKGKSRQEIADPGQEEGDDSASKDPRTHPHLEGTALLSSEMQNLAMGFPGIEKLQTPMEEAESQTAKSYNNQDLEESNENPSPETAQAAMTEVTPEESNENNAGTGGITPDDSGNGFRETSLGNIMEQQGGLQSSPGDLLSSFSYHPSQEELPAEAFGDTGNPNMYGTGADGQSTESASRRTDIPGDDEGMVIKRQALAFPYGSFYPGYMMAHQVNPLYHYAPINNADQQVMAYPSVYPFAHPGLTSPGTQVNPLLAHHPSHSIHVGAPNVNVDVQTSRERIAESPENQKVSRLKHMMRDFSRKLKFNDKKSHSPERRRKEKRQLPSVFSSRMMNRPMGFSAPQIRYPVSNAAGFVQQSMNPSLQQSLQQVQPFNINAMSRSGLSSFTSPFRTPAIRSPFNPSQMAYSRQLSGVTGISLPLSVQPGMGIVGVASRKKRSSSKKMLKKENKSTKRQFLAGFPQGFESGAYSPFALPRAPFTGVGLPVLPSFPTAQTRPMAFRSGDPPVFSPRLPQSSLSAMRMSSFPSGPIPGLSPFIGFPSVPNNPFLKGPQPENVNFFSGGAASPWSPSAAGRQMAPGPALSGGMRERFPQGFEGNRGSLVQEMKQPGGGEPLQMNGEQVAGFNAPSGMNFVEQQPTPMYSQEGRGSETPELLSMGPQREMAGFIRQLPVDSGLLERSSNFNMQSNLASLKKSSVPSKKHNKGKPFKSRKKVTS